MRIRFLLFCSLVLAACLWILLNRTAKQTIISAGSHEVQVAHTNQQFTNQPLQTENSIVEKPSPTVITAKTASQTSNASQQIISEWQSPIEFYGKVVDENTNPIEGASVQFQWDESPTVDVARTSVTKSDSDGLFSLQGARGRSLEVSVSKEGYYTSRRDKTGYMFALATEKFSPSRLNPVIFHLRKKEAGENLIRVKQNYRVPRDGTPVGIDLTTGKAITEGGGDIVVQCWTDDQGKQSGQKYDWRCLVTIPNGGLVLSDEEFPFSAPENGYTPTNEIVMPADRPDWRNDVDLKFFYQLPNGHYGRMTFSMIAGGQHFCMIDSFLNPSGSKNLEPAQ
jgi:hypothetical protein